MMMTTNFSEIKNREYWFQNLGGGEEIRVFGEKLITASVRCRPI